MKATASHRGMVMPLSVAREERACILIVHCYHGGMPKKEPVRKGGARRKSPEGLTVALPILADRALVDGLNGVTDRWNEEDPSRKVSRADVIRSILWAAVKRSEGRSSKGAKS